MQAANGSGLMEPDELARQYAAQVREGAPLGSGYYVRAFPVWFSYRGNYNVLLSEAVSMNTSAAFRGMSRCIKPRRTNSALSSGKTRSASPPW